MEENNILIAEFLEFDILSNGYYQWQGEMTRSLPDFRNDWNWLMKAVEQLKLLGVIKGIKIGFNDNEGSYNEIILDNDKIFSVTGKEQQEGLFETIVNFIKWYKTTQI